MIYGDDAKSHFDNAVRIVILVLIFVFDPGRIIIDCESIISLRQYRIKKNLTKSPRDDQRLKAITTTRKEHKKVQKKTKRL